MRIISPFRDFYDSVQRQGMDKDVIYLREQKAMLINDDFEVYRHPQSDYVTHLEYLGFCGDIYRIFKIMHPKSGFEIIYYDFEEFRKGSLVMGATSKYDFGRKWWKSAFDKFAEEDTAPLKELFHKYQVPLFLVRDSLERNKQEIVLNPRLSNLKFQTIKGPYTAYQDIFQYVAGVLNSPENKMVKISDKDKIHKHGFDKWSFRKLPTKRK